MFLEEEVWFSHPFQHLLLHVLSLFHFPTCPIYTPSHTADLLELAAQKGHVSCEIFCGLACLLPL